MSPDPSPTPGASAHPSLRQQLHALDVALYRAVAETPTPTLDRPLRHLSNAANRSGLWLVITGIMASSGRTARTAAVSGVAAIGVSSAVANLVLKPVWRRRRPDRTEVLLTRTKRVRMPASTSFPSGHAASAFAFATATTSRMPAAGLPLLTLAAAVAYSRVHTGVHYPGDVVVGSLLGIGAGTTVAAAMRRLEPHLPGHPLGRR